MSSDEDGTEEEEDSDSDEEQLNADGSVILMSRRGRGVLHETQMTQRRTWRGNQAARESAEYLVELERISREACQADGIIKSLLGHYLLHRSLSCFCTAGVYHATTLHSSTALQSSRTSTPTS